MIHKSKLWTPDHWTGHLFLPYAVLLAGNVLALVILAVWHP